MEEVMSKKNSTVATIKALVKELVAEEFRTQREQLIMEVKAEMFDVLLKANSSGHNSADVIVEHTSQETPSAEFNTSDLKTMFNAIQPSFDEYKSNVSVNTPTNKSLVTTTNLPASYEGKADPVVAAKTLDKINNTDYSSIMKSMGIS